MQLSRVLSAFLFTSLVSASEFSGFSWDDGCLRSLFPGPFSSEAELLDTIFSAADERVIEAFIACPAQMVEIYFEKLSKTGESFIESVKASERIEEFYSALKGTPNFETNEIPTTTDLINVLSYVHDVPEEYYLGELIESDEVYSQALLLKIIRTGDQQAKETLINISRNQLATWTAFNSPRSELSSQMIKYFTATIAFINGEVDIDITGMDPFARLGLSIYASVFERYEMVEYLLEDQIIPALALHSLKIACVFKSFKDEKRVIAIYRNHISEEDKVNFDEMFGRP